MFGGTFDPPHIGHMVTAVRAAEQLDLDVVLLVVAGVPWQKVRSRAISSERDRLDMVAASARGERLLEVCDLEIRRGGDSHTIETLESLRSMAPDDDLVLILGADAANGLDSWERAEDLRTACTVAVADRPGVSVAPPVGFLVERFEVPQLDISSTELRRMVARGRSVRFLVPDGAVAIIDERRLYRVDHDDDRQ